MKMSNMFKDMWVKHYSGIMAAYAPKVTEKQNF